MTSKRQGEPEQALSWEEGIARYLQDHPGFFLDHPDILAGLPLRHQESGQAVSLIERQVQVLRSKNDALGRQLRDLLAVARENDILGERLHQFAVAMIDSAALDEVLTTAPDMLRQQFKLDGVRIHLKGESAALHGRPEWVEPGDQRFDALVQKFARAGEPVPTPARSQAGRPLCGVQYDRDTTHYLFGAQAGEMGSSALVLLDSGDTTGVLCLGSRDPTRFHPNMGTVYLSKFGELLMSAISRHL
jgi:uncharacterized protein YigA (DUF484 family)